MKKINLVELLRDCPKGMELDCTSYNNVSFDKISDDKNAIYPIFCYITDKKGNRTGISFTGNGCESKRYGAKCVIFPKGKTTWEGFVPPCKFRDGDIVATKLGSVFILKNSLVADIHSCYVALNHESKFICKEQWFAHKDMCRFATEEEKEKIFKAIKDNGYKWNDETKTLEKLIKPKFKVGNRIRNNQVDLGNIYTIVEVGESLYVVNKNNENNNYNIDFTLQDDWNLAPNKFDITTLKAFESRVLVRDYDNRMWIPTFWGKRLEDDSNCSYLTTNGCYKYCIPYEHNEHLLGTTNDCDNFYKTWEK